MRSAANFAKKGRFPISTNFAASRQAEYRRMQFPLHFQPPVPSPPTAPKPQKTIPFPISWKDVKLPSENDDDWLYYSVGILLAGALIFKVSRQ